MFNTKSRVRKTLLYLRMDDRANSSIDKAGLGNMLYNVGQRIKKKSASSVIQTKEPVIATYTSNLLLLSLNIETGMAKSRNPITPLIKIRIIPKRRSPLSLPENMCLRAIVSVSSAEVLILRAANPYNPKIIGAYHKITELTSCVSDM